MKMNTLKMLLLSAAFIAPGLTMFGVSEALDAWLRFGSDDDWTKFGTLGSWGGPVIGVIGAYLVAMVQIRTQMRITSTSKDLEKAETRKHAIDDLSRTCTMLMLSHSAAVLYLEKFKSALSSELNRKDRHIDDHTCSDSLMKMYAKPIKDIKEYLCLTVLGLNRLEEICAKTNLLPEWSRIVDIRFRCEQIERETSFSLTLNKLESAIRMGDLDAMSDVDDDILNVEKRLADVRDLLEWMRSVENNLILDNEVAKSQLRRMGVAGIASSPRPEPGVPPWKGL